MSASRTFAYWELTVRVEASDPWVLTSLEEFLTPSFTVSERRGADCTVTLDVNDREYRQTLQRGPQPDGEGVDCFALDSGLGRLPLWVSADEERVIFDGGSRVFYFVNGDSSHIRVLAERQRPSWRVALMRVVREYALTRSGMGTSLVVHAGAIAVGERAIGIAGPKGAGKTSLLLHLLQRCAGAAFVSNDRVVVDLDGSVPVLHGLPTVVMIRHETLRLFPEYAAALRGAGYDHRFALAEAPPHSGRADPAEPVALAPAHLCVSMGVEMRGRAVCSVLLFPRVTDQGTGIAVRELSAREVADRLRTVLPGGGPLPLRSQVFGLARHRSAKTDPAAVARLCRAIASQLRCFDCVLAGQAYRADSAARLIDRVLAPAPGTPTRGGLADH